MTILERLAAQAFRLGFDTLDVEYKDGFEEVCGLKDGIGFGIARFRSSSAEGAALRRELYGNVKKVLRVALTMRNSHCAVRCGTVSVTMPFG